MTISFDDSEVKENELLIKIKKGYKSTKDYKPTRLSFNFSFLTFHSLLMIENIIYLQKALIRL